MGVFDREKQSYQKKIGRMRDNFGFQNMFRAPLIFSDFCIFSFDSCLSGALFLYFHFIFIYSLINFDSIPFFYRYRFFVQDWLGEVKNWPLRWARKSVHLFDFSKFFGVVFERENKHFQCFIKLFVRRQTMAKFCICCRFWNKKTKQICEILQNFCKFWVGQKIFVLMSFWVFSSGNGRTGRDMHYFLFSKFFRIFFWSRKFEAKVDFSDFASTNSIEIFVIFRNFWVLERE